MRPKIYLTQYISFTSTSYTQKDDRPRRLKSNGSISISEKENEGNSEQQLLSPPPPMKKKNLTIIAAPKKKNKNLLRTMLLRPSNSNTDDDDDDNPMSYYHTTPSTMTTTTLMELPPCTPLLDEFNSFQKKEYRDATPRVLLEQFDVDSTATTTTAATSTSGISAG